MRQIPDVRILWRRFRKVSPVGVAGADEEAIAQMTAGRIVEKEPARPMPECQVPRVCVRESHGHKEKEGGRGRGEGGSRAGTHGPANHEPAGTPTTPHAPRTLLKRDGLRDVEERTNTQRKRQARF